jgi:hypothetical protein
MARRAPTSYRKGVAIMPPPHAQRAAIARAVRDGHHDKADELRADYWASKAEALIAAAPPRAVKHFERLRQMLTVPLLLMAILMVVLTPAQRSQRARLAALVRWSKENPAANAARGQAGLLARFEREVDPDNVLPAAERTRRAEAARKAHMARLALKSSQARSKGAA